MPYLLDAFVFLAAVVIAAPLATRLGLGSVIGYLAAGIAIGPHALGLFAGGPEDAAKVMHAAEFGVVLLLFLVGLELEPRRLVELRRRVFGLGAAQVVASSALLAVAARLAGLPWPAAIVTGLGLSLSSTAFVLQLLGERNERATPHGQAAFGILLFQDLAVIPMLAAIPLLGAPHVDSAMPAWLAPLRAVAVVAAVVVGSRIVARPTLRFVASLRNPEILTATALLLVVGTALLVSLAGLSMALGAFLAGVLLASSEYRHELEADIAPFKGLLLGLFFVSVGLGVDLRLVRERPGTVLAIVVGLVLVKALLGYAIGRAALGRGDPAASLGLLLSQGGEFAFVLFGVAAGDGALGGETSALLVAAVALSMTTTPPLYALYTRFVRPRLRRAPAREQSVEPDGDPPVIIAGFGRVGQVVGRVLRAKHIAFTALDASPEHIEFIQRFGNKVFYGDASRPDLLRAARAERARVFVLAIDEVEASLRTAEIVLAQFPHLTVFARARNRQHAYRLRRLGVTRIFRETLATSLEITAGVLEEMGLDYGEARGAVERFRKHDDELFEESWRDQDDLQKLTDVSRRGREDLERLFEEDAARRRSA